MGSVRAAHRILPLSQSGHRPTTPLPGSRSAGSDVFAVRREGGIYMSLAASGAELRVWALF